MNIHEISVGDEQEGVTPENSEEWLRCVGCNEPFEDGEDAIAIANREERR